MTATRRRPGAIELSALAWGFQFAFLTPSLALLLTSLYNATAAEVGTALAISNAGGFVASLVVPSIADRRRDYLGPMVLCGVLTLLLVTALWAATTLPLAIIALVVLGGPAGVGSALLFAHLRHSGTPQRAVFRTRAIVSFAWVAGPPLATFIIGLWGARALLPTIGVIAVSNIALSLWLRRGRREAPAEVPPSSPDAATPTRKHWWVVGVIVAAFVLLQATNNTVVSVMSLYVTEQLHIDIVWAGIALGTAALLEIPALLIVGRLHDRIRADRLIVAACSIGILYYAGMTVVSGPAMLIALQVLNAVFFAAVSGVGLTLFQHMIPGPGLASGMFTNTRRVGNIISGGIIAVSTVTPLGYAGVFAICAVLTAAALVAVALGRRATVQPDAMHVRST